MRAFVTGATGFIGANLVRRLLEYGYEVHVLIRPESKRWRIEDILSNLHLHEGDLQTADFNHIFTTSQPDVIFHLGVFGAYQFQTEPRQILETTVFGTLRLLQAAKQSGVKILVAAGSSSEYGTKQHPMHEDELVEPNTYYAIGKVTQTHLCQHFSRVEKLPTVSLRLFSVYGPYEEPGRLVPTLIRKSFANEALEMADPSIARDYIYVDDVIDAFMVAADHPEYSGEVFNVGTGEQTCLRDIVAQVLRLTGSNSGVNWGAYAQRSFDTSIWVADTVKVYRNLGFRAQHSLEDGLRKTINWFNANNKYHATT